MAWGLASLTAFSPSVQPPQRMSLAGTGTPVLYQAARSRPPFPRKILLQPLAALSGILLKQQQCLGCLCLCCIVRFALPPRAELGRGSCRNIGLHFARRRISGKRAQGKADGKGNENRVILGHVRNFSRGTGPMVSMRQVLYVSTNTEICTVSMYRFTWASHNSLCPVPESSQQRHSVCRIEHYPASALSSIVNHVR